MDSVALRTEGLEPLYREHIGHSMKDVNNNIRKPEVLADFATGLTSAPEADLQEVLNELNVERRLERALELLKVELVHGARVFSFDEHIVLDDGTT
jgi:Lon-like ATP-dependent protease